MTRILLTLIILLFFVVKGISQPYFIYIQSDNKQTFTVTLKGKTYHSSNTGYVVIPKLFSGTYNLQIETARKAKLVYNVKLDKKDIGLSLEENPRNELVLVSLQTKEPLSPEVINNDALASTPPAVIKPALNAEQEQKEKPAKVVAVKEKEETEEPVDEEPPMPAKRTRGIIKNLEKSSREGVTLQFIDFYQEKEDTIDVLIPSLEEIKPQPDDSEKVTGKTEPAQVPVVKSPAVVETPAPVAVSPADVDSISNPANQQAQATKSNTASNCAKYADDDDFLELRRKLAVGKTHERMIVTAVKAFKTRCYSTAQIKNLGHMFLNDQARFQFFEAALPYTADAENYMMLEPLLLDSDYKQKFRDLIRK